MMATKASQNSSFTDVQLILTNIEAFYSHEHLQCSPKGKQNNSQQMLISTSEMSEDFEFSWALQLYFYTP